MTSKHLCIYVVASLSAMGIAVCSAQSQSSVSDGLTVAVLGTGDMGNSFGPRLAEQGYRVIYGSRTPGSERVQALVKQTGHGASADTSRNAAHAADIVLIAIAARAVETVVKGLGSLEGKVIIDLTWPPTEYADDGYEEIVVATSGAERIQAWQPKSHVVKAFGTLGSIAIDNPGVAGGPITVPIAGDDRAAKETVAAMAVKLGLDPVDAGPLRHARYIEGMMLLYLVPHLQERSAGWEFYFRRSNYWQCNPYTGGEFEEGIPTIVDAGNLAIMPSRVAEPEPCP